MNILSKNATPGVNSSIPKSIKRYDRSYNQSKSNHNANKRFDNQRGSENRSFWNITSQSTLPQIDSLNPSRNPLNLSINPGTDFSTNSNLIKLDASIKSSIVYKFIIRK